VGIPAQRTPLSLEELRARRETILQLAQRHGAHDVRIFGSVARGDAHRGSDVDFLVPITTPDPLAMYNAPRHVQRTAPGPSLEEAMPCLGGPEAAGVRRAGQPSTSRARYSRGLTRKRLLKALLR